METNVLPLSQVAYFSTNWIQADIQTCKSNQHTNKLCGCLTTNSIKCVHIKLAKTSSETNVRISKNVHQISENTSTLTTEDALDQQMNSLWFQPVFHRQLAPKVANSRMPEFRIGDEILRRPSSPGNLRTIGRRINKKHLRVWQFRLWTVTEGFWLLFYIWPVYPIFSNGTETMQLTRLRRTQVSSP